MIGMRWFMEQLWKSKPLDSSYNYAIILLLCITIMKVTLLLFYQGTTIYSPHGLEDRLKGSYDAMAVGSGQWRKLSKYCSTTTPFIRKLPVNSSHH
jgi:hypothetical protein